MKIKRFMMALFLTTCLMFSNCEVISAKTTEISPGKIAVTGHVTNADFMNFMEATQYTYKKHYHIMIHTPGGDAYSTIAMINRIEELKKRGVTFTTETYGWASSAGSYLFLMGDERIAHSGAEFLWHTMEMANSHKHDMLPPSQKSSYERMDRYVTQKFRDVTGISEQLIRYFLYNKNQRAIYMSAEEAKFYGIVTKLVD